MNAAGFDVFPPGLLPFLSDLKANNTREWFEAHRDAYEADYRAPAEAFGQALAAAVSARRDAAHRAKIFRIHRDVRFSRDKTPYKTHLHIAVIPEDGEDSSQGWFFGVEPGKLTLGAGRFGFDKPGLERFRAKVAGQQGEALSEVLEAMEAAGVRVSKPELKRPPKGFEADHPRLDLLRRKSLTVWLDKPDHRRIEQPGLVAHCIGQFQRIAPLMDWFES